MIPATRKLADSNGLTGSSCRRRCFALIKRAKLEQKLEENPRNVGALEQLAHVLYENGEFPEAMDRLVSCLELGARDPLLYTKLGMCLYNVQAMAEASSAFSKGLSMTIITNSTTELDIRSHAARALVASGKYEQALEVCEKYGWRGAKKQPARLDEWSLKSLRFGGQGALHVYAASICVVLSYFDRALKHYELASKKHKLELAPYSQEDIWLLVSRAYYLSGEPELKEQALKQAPGCADRWYALSAIHELQENYHAAIDALEESLFREPFNPSLLRAQARCVSIIDPHDTERIQNLINVAQEAMAQGIDPSDFHKPVLPSPSKKNKSQRIRVKPFVKAKFEDQVLGNLELYRTNCSRIEDDVSKKHSKKKKKRALSRTTNEKRKTPYEDGRLEVSLRRPSTSPHDPRGTSLKIEMKDELNETCADLGNIGGSHHEPAGNVAYETESKLSTPDTSTGSQHKIAERRVDLDISGCKDFDLSTTEEGETNANGRRVDIDISGCKDLDLDALKGTVKTKQNETLTEDKPQESKTPPESVLRKPAEILHGTLLDADTDDDSLLHSNALAGPGMLLLAQMSKEDNLRATVFLNPEQMELVQASSPENKKSGEETPSTTSEDVEEKPSTSEAAMNLLDDIDEDPVVHEDEGESSNDSFDKNLFQNLNAAIESVPQPKSNEETSHNVEESEKGESALNPGNRYAEGLRRFSSQNLLDALDEPSEEDSDDEHDLEHTLAAAQRLLDEIDGDDSDSIGSDLSEKSYH